MKIADKRKKTRFYEKKAFSAGGGAGKAKGAIIGACGDFADRPHTAVFLSADCADSRRLWRPVLPLTRPFTPPGFSPIGADCRLIQLITPPDWPDPSDPSDPSADPTDQTDPPEKSPFLSADCA
ncbi:MAG: hypothetical protein GX945_03125, partial [Lentisphaerae bacterium]|nr:hypothetical protein [Lentisphaerota bacterium]